MPTGLLVPAGVRIRYELMLAALPGLRDALEAVAHERAEAQLGAHERVRTTSRATGRVAIEPAIPVDLPGAYVLLPLLPSVREHT